MEDLVPGISEGPLFRPVAKGGRLIAQRLEAEAVCDIVQAYAKRLGLKGAGTFDGIFLTGIMAVLLAGF
jgi:hypothetical protein